MIFKRIFLLITVFAFSLTASAQEINWMSFSEAVKANEKEPRKFIIDVYTDWCGWCKKMDRNTFGNPVIADYINKNYYAVKMDGEHKKDILFKDRTYKFVPRGKRGYHELPAELMGGKMSYPTIVYLDEDYGIIQSIPGYRSAKELEPIIKYFGENAYKKMKWEDYQKQHQSALN